MIDLGEDKMAYNCSKQTELSFDETVVRVKEALKKEGFGVLTEIDVKKTLKEKLNEDFDDYVILGACNPSFAFKALQAEKEIGLLLPCNVIVFSSNGKTMVSAVNPVEAMSMVNNSKLAEIAQNVKEKLERIVNNV
jgi:uncharacterized protein (DUF302 family)